jgi:hypothetical protein
MEFSRKMEDLTTPELLDALASEVGSLAEKVRALSGELEAAKGTASEVQQPGANDDVHCSFPVSPCSALTPEALRVQMNYAGLTKATFAEVFGIAQETVEQWLSGEGSIPAWVLRSVHIFELLSPSERKRFMRPTNGSCRNPAKTHPFARIEEL